MAELIRLAAANEADPQRLPRNIEAEAAFLGAILIDNRIIEDVSIKLQPDHFFEPLHGRIFEQILRLIDRNMLVTPVTLKPFFEADEAMRELGGPGYLIKLTADGAGLIGARDFAQQIYDLALLRELVTVGRTLVDNALDTSESVDPKGQIEAAESALYKVAEGEGETGSMKSFLQASTEAISNVAKALNSGGSLSGITTGLSSINAKCGGLHNSDLVILAGRPGMGKTSLATNIAFNIAKAYEYEVRPDGVHIPKNGGIVGFFSLEMSAEQLAMRLLAAEAKISSHSLQRGNLTNEEFANLVRCSQELARLPFHIDDTPALSISAVRTRARRMKRVHNLSLLVVDYLQLVRGASNNSQQNRVQEISEITQGLKAIAKELNIPVIALSQLSRAVEQREDKRPQLADLRESGSIEQDADLVMFVFREEYYLGRQEPRPDTNEHAEWQQKMEKIHGLAQVIVAKHRNGPICTVDLHFNSEFTQFENRAQGEHFDAY